MVFSRRKHLRMPVVWKATVTRLNGEQLPGSTDNVSIDGVNIILPKPLVLGEPVKIDIVTQCLGRTCCFSLQGVAVYADALADNLGIAVGLRLLEADPHYTSLVEGLDSGRPNHAIA